MVREFDEVQQGAQTEEALSYEDVKSTTTTIPFVKDNELDYSKLNPTQNDYVIGYDLCADCNLLCYSYFQWGKYY